MSINKDVPKALTDLRQTGPCSQTVAPFLRISRMVFCLHIRCTNTTTHAHKRTHIRPTKTNRTAADRDKMQEKLCASSRSIHERKICAHCNKLTSQPNHKSASGRSRFPEKKLYIYLHTHTHTTYAITHTHTQSSLVPNSPALTENSSLLNDYTIIYALKHFSFRFT